MIAPKVMQVELAAESYSIVPMLTSYTMLRVLQPYF